MIVRILREFATQLIGLKWFRQMVSRTDIKQTPFGLYDFADEILLLIMLNMDSEDLLIMANVCERFRAIAKDAFGKQYCGSGRYFYIELSGCVTDEIDYEPYFNIFGENMGAFEISLFRRNTIVRNHWLTNQIQNRCNSSQLTKLKIAARSLLPIYYIDLELLLSCMPKLTYLNLLGVTLIDESWTTKNYSQLIHFDCSLVSITSEGLTRFLMNNEQLETLQLDHFYDCETKFIQSLNGMKLKNLCLCHLPLMQPMPNSVEMVNLESLQLQYSERLKMNIILKAITPSKNISAIKLKCDHWDNDVADILCQYNKLKSISITTDKLKLEHLKRMVDQHPNLQNVTLDCVSDFDDIGEFIAHTILVSTKWENISIGIPEVPELKYSLIFKIAEATQNNPQMKIKLYKNNNFITRTNYYVEYTFNQGIARRNNQILHWNGYDHINSQTSTGFLDLNERCVQKLLGFMSLNDLAALFNTCVSTQNAVKLYLKENTVHATIASANLGENVLECLGQYILRASVSHRINPHVCYLQPDHKDEFYVEARKSWQNVNRHCINLTELTVDSFDDYCLDEFNHPWLKLNKFNISRCRDVGYGNLLKFPCPQLTHLKFGDIFQNVGLNFDDLFPSLTSLEFREFNEDVRESLMRMGDSFCLQIQHLSLGNRTENYLRTGGEVNKIRASKLIEAVCRFSNAAAAPQIIIDCCKLMLDA